MATLKPRLHISLYSLARIVIPLFNLESLSVTIRTAHNPLDLVDLAVQVQKADEFIRANAINKMAVIADQIRYLQQQARKVLEEASRDYQLHHAVCNFKKIPGKMYFLYKRTNGETYFSMLSPSDWGSTCPHEFLCGYKLEYDMSWTPSENVDKRNQEIQLLEKVLRAQKALTDSPVLNINLDQLTYSN